LRAINNCADDTDNGSKLTPMVTNLPSTPSASSDVELMLNVNCLEEPIWPPENYDGLAQLRKSCGIQVAAGDNSSTLLWILIVCSRYGGWTLCNRALPKQEDQRIV
jgi:hypothetical protein